MSSSRGSTDNEDGNSTDDRPPDTPLCLEDLIQLEHNYAAIFINTLERFVLPFIFYLYFKQKKI